jgi:hypothetical protein
MLHIRLGSVLMVAVGTYLFTGGGKAAALKPSDGVGPVLDAIDRMGSDGADIDTLMKYTGYDENFVIAVLRDVQRDGMAEQGSDNRYRLTDFGVKARYLVAR